MALWAAGITLPLYVELQGKLGIFEFLLMLKGSIFVTRIVVFMVNYSSQVILHPFLYVYFLFLDGFVFVVFPVPTPEHWTSVSSPRHM